MRTERFFVEHLGPSLNAIMGAKKNGKWLGVGLYIATKKKVGEVMQYAGVHRLEPFERPIEIWYFPKVVRGPSGHISKGYDCLNFGITYKIIEDWLVKFGKIPDDSREYVYGAHSMRAEEADDGIPGILVGILEVGQPFPHQDSLELAEPPPF